MQYAYINGVKSLPIKGIRGTCIGCGNAMIAKCGNIYMHHWAHAVATKCDSWWENETEWHREWKNLFPEEYREITFYDKQLEEYHRADVHTKKGLTVEFQNSPLSTAELKDRNDFYQNIIWVVNGKKFAEFNIAENIPSPNDAALKDFAFVKGWQLKLKHTNGVTYSFTNTQAALKFGFNKIQRSNTHYSFVWKHAHKAWFMSTKPIFFDFGGHFLYWLRCKKQQESTISSLQTDDYWYLQSVSKNDFLAKYGS